MTKETTIRTQNVPALQLEEAIPIGVSLGSTKSAREVFTIAPKAMRDKAELTEFVRNYDDCFSKFTSVDAVKASFPADL